MSNGIPPITAVIVTYNSLGHINDALTALRESHAAGLTECVVVDNAGSDGTADFVAANYPWVTLVRSARNLGFGRGCNLGFQHVRTPFVLIHNPDAVMGKKGLQTMLDFMDHRRQAGIVAPAIVDGEGSLQAAGLMTTPASLLRSSMGFGKAMPRQQWIAPGGEPFQTPWVCGAMMLIRSDLFRRLGGFDPRFFLYFEETDLCRRAAQDGAEIWAVGQAVAGHLGGACAKTTGKDMTSSCISEHFYRSRFYYLVKHFGWLRAVPAETLFYMAQRLRCLRSRLKGRVNFAKNYKPPFLKFPDYPEDI